MPQTRAVDNIVLNLEEWFVVLYKGLYKEVLMIKRGL